jgi:phage terminase large subunit-like protein
VNVTGWQLMEMLRLDNGSKWGTVATDVQREDAQAILKTSRDVHFHFLSRARGYSKTSDLAGVSLAVLLTQAPAMSRSVAVAADQEQAGLLLDAMRGFVFRMPPLADLLDVQATRVISKRTGASIQAIPADAAGSWGLRPYFVVADELAQWGESGSPRRVWDAISTSVPKVPGSRMVVITTAGSPGHWARKVRDHAEHDPLWRLSEVTGPPPWMSRAMLAEQERRLLPSTYARYFLNLWTSAEDSLVSEDDLAACAVLDGPVAPQQNTRYVIGVDVGIKRDRTVAAVCHAEPVRKQIDSLGTQVTAATRVQLDRMEVWQGNRERPVRLQEVEDWIAEAAKNYRPATVRLDNWQAVGMMQRLQARGIKCEEFTFSASSVGRIAAALHRQLRDRMLALPDDPDLLDELRHVRLRETAPGVVRLDHDSDGHDDRAVALALCVHKLLDGPAGPPPQASFTTLGRWDVERGSLHELLIRPEQHGVAKLEPGMRL